jgi:hypothetical protein
MSIARLDSLREQAVEVDLMVSVPVVKLRGVNHVHGDVEVRVIAALDR